MNGVKLSSPFDIGKIRDDFPFLERRIHGEPIVYLDNAATSQKPRSVIEAFASYYAHSCSSVHRAIHTLSIEATEFYEEARRTVARFINADEGEIVFVRNTTEAINLVSRCLAGPGKVVTTEAEHHSNLLPWGAHRDVEHVGLTEDGAVDLDALRTSVNRETLLVSVSHVSNVLGFTNPVHDIVEIAHRSGALCLVDAAQSVPHMRVDVRELDCDFLAFSGHKMLAPAGIGVLFVRREHFERLRPFLVGGSAVKEVRRDGWVSQDPPWCFEAGTPNVEAALALGSAIDYLLGLGMENVAQHSRSLTMRCVEGLRAIRGIEVYGGAAERASLVSFNVHGIGCHAVAKILSKRRNIMIRSGFHCAQPLLESMGVGPTARASFYVYNTPDEVDLLLDMLDRLARFLV